MFFNDQAGCTLVQLRYLEQIRERLKNFPVVSVLGPRQVGKTTLAHEIASRQPSHFLIWKTWISPDLHGFTRWIWIARRWRHG